MPNDYTKPLRAAEILTAWYGLAVNLGTSSGSANALAGASADDTSNTFTTGRLYRIRTNNANSGAVTVAKNGGTGVAIRKSPSSAALVSGDLASGAELLLFYDGTYLQILAGLNAGSLTTPGLTSTAAVQLTGTQSSPGSGFSGFYRDASGNIIFNGSSSGSIQFGAGNYVTTTASDRGIGFIQDCSVISAAMGVARYATGLILQTTAVGCIGQHAKLQTRSNSTAYTICTLATGDTARVLFEDSQDKQAVAKVTTAGVVSFTSDSHADYVASSSPASGEIGVYVTGGNLTIKPGSAGTRGIAAFPLRGIA